MKTYRHETLGSYQVGKVRGRFIRRNGSVLSGQVEIVVPSDFAKSLDLVAMADPAKKWASTAEPNALLDIIYGDLAAAHPGALLVCSYSTRCTLPSEYGVDAGVECLHTAWDGLVFTKGTSSYTVRKASDATDLKRRIGQAMKALHAAEAKRQKTGGIRLDPLARWVLANLRPHAVDAVASKMAEWDAAAPGALHSKYGNVRLDLNCIDVVGVPVEVRITLGRNHVVSATMSPSAEIKMSGIGATVYHVPDTIVAILAGRMASDLAAHPAMADRRIKTATNNLARTKGGQTSYAQIAFEHEEPTPYTPDMVKAAPFRPGEAEALLEALLGKYQVGPIVRHIIDTTDADRMLAELHPIIVQGRHNRTSDRHFTVTDKEIRFNGRLAPNVTWTAGVIKITDLPQTVLATLRAQCLGGPVRKVVDHPAFTGYRVTAAQEVPATKPQYGQPEPAHFAIRIAQEEADLPLAA